MFALINESSLSGCYVDFGDARSFREKVEKVEGGVRSNA